MSLVPAASANPYALDPRAIHRKVARRILPLVFVLYVIAYLDRANLGFAMEGGMDQALKFSPAVFGWGGGLFYAGYLLLEIPGALLVERWSARKWFARILVTWGFCSMAMALVRTPGQFYLARFLLGLAEAGFFPGIIVYFTHWFPRAQRGRAIAGLVLGVPVSMALGARVSGWLMEVNWFDLDGWQWVFIVEGFPAVLMGVAIPFLLTDRPRQAKWLTPAEREWLEETLEEERRTASAVGGATLGQALRRPTVWLLALGIFAANTGGYAIQLWLPKVVEALLLTTQGWVTKAAVFDWMTLIYACGLAGVWLSGRSSHFFSEWKWHAVAGMALTGVFLAASVRPGQSWNAVFGWLCLVGFFCVFWPSPFWVLPTLSLSASTAAVSIGFINMSANLAGLVSQPLVGQLRTTGWDDRACLLLLAGCYVVAGLTVALLRVPETRSERPVDTGAARNVNSGVTSNSSPDERVRGASQTAPEIQKGIRDQCD